MNETGKKIMLKSSHQAKAKERGKYWGQKSANRDNGQEMREQGIGGRCLPK